MLAVVAVFGDKLLTGAASLADLVAVGVVVVVPVALHEQAVAFDVGQVGDGQVVLGEQVAGRVMGEAFRGAAAHADQAIQRVVVEAAVAFSAVVDACQIAICVVRVVAVEQVAVLLADAVGLKAALVIVLILAEQQTLLALLFATGCELVRGQARAVEVNAAKLAAALVVVIEFAAVRQAAMAQLAKRVVLVTRGAPALMLGNQAILQVVFVSERPVTVVDADQAAESVVAVVDGAAIGQGFDQQAASAVTLILGDEFAAVVAELGFLEQLAVEVVFIGRAAAIEAGFPLDQAIAVVVEMIVLATLVFDLGE
ncbi:hypothetical protein PS689_05492 [Pseudomonas fluorescens]|nr:hypothetical protein PS689_05492 [Pseudomonas fluorescens]